MTNRRASAVAALVALALAPLTLALGACEGPPPNCDSSSPPFDLVGERAADPGCPDGPTPDTPLPIPLCEGCGSGTGEPHLRTFDQRRFDLQAAAELVATRSLDDDFEVQWRLVPYDPSVSVIGAAALRIGGERVEITAGEEEPLRIDGDPVVIPDGVEQVRDSGVSVRHLGNTWVVAAPGGAPWVTTDVWSGFLNVEIGLADDQHGRVEGVLGDADGDPANDLVLADGTALSADPTFEELYPAFADAWRVDADTTLFDHPDGIGPDDYWVPDFPQRSISSDDLAPDVRARAEAVCVAAGVTDPVLLEDCTFDYAVTGDSAFVDATVELQGRRSDQLRTGSTGRARWDWLAPDQQAVGAPLLVDGARHVLVTARAEGTDTTTLSALDLDGGGLAWSTEGTSSRCTVAVSDAGIVALTDDGGPASLVVLDDATGRVKDAPRHTPDRAAEELALDRCRSPLIASGDTIVAVLGSTLQAFASSDLRAVWQLELPATPDLDPVLTADGTGLWVAHPSPDGQSTRVVLVDLVAGRVSAETVLDGVRVADPRSGVASGGSLVLGLRARSDESRVGSVALLDRSGSSLRQVWERDLGGPDARPDLSRVPLHLAVAGSNVVGFTTDRVVSAFALDSGEAVWSHQVGGFTNNGGLVAADDRGRTFVSTFSGPWLEVVGPDGSTEGTIESQAIFGGAGVEEMRAIGPVTDDAVLTLSPSNGGGTAVAVVEVPGR